MDLETKMTNARSDELWIEFLKLGERFEDMGSDFFGSHIFLFCSKLIFDLAPNMESAKELINHSVQAGLNWHISDMEKANG